MWGIKIIFYVPFVRHSCIVLPVDIIMKSMCQIMPMLKFTGDYKIYFSFMIISLGCIKAVLTCLTDTVSKGSSQSSIYINKLQCCAKS